LQINLWVHFFVGLEQRCARPQLRHLNSLPPAETRAQIELERSHLALARLGSASAHPKQDERS
jgi:hypothetical protein